MPGSSLVAMGRALVASGLVPKRAILAAAVRDARFRRRGSSDCEAAGLRDQALAAVAGLERAPLLAADVADKVVATVSPGARLLVELHLVAGDFCVLLSASPQELVEAVCARLGLHRAVGTRAEVVDDHYTGRLAGPFCCGRGKVARLGEALGPVDLGRAWAYADSLSDLPILEASGHPVAVNPDRHLSAVASKSGWPVLRVA
ncbi:MAG: HAD family hydrolase [Acidimicrobiales bacterium]